MPDLTIIAPFEVPTGQEDILREQWHRGAERLSHMSGFLSARLYEISPEVEEYVQSHITGLKWLEQRFRFVNIARWASAAHYEAALRAPLDRWPVSFTSYPAFYRLYGGLDRPSVPQEARTGQEFTFIVPFEVPEGQEEEMHSQFQAVVAGMEHREGSLGPGLYELDTEADAHLRPLLSSRLQNSAQFRFVNVAEWASVMHYEATMRSRRHIKPISFTGHGAYYRVAAQYTGQNA
ncbi:MAG: antibiotic biosynthesis monooxygenase [Ktedonobacteraceae bacterium]|nr:antibiotic biosynthesis monooxygenase [Ktedonobacteraceae bacterium]